MKGKLGIGLTVLIVVLLGYFLLTLVNRASNPESTIGIPEAAESSPVVSMSVDDGSCMGSAQLVDGKSGESSTANITCSTGQTCTVSGTDDDIDAHIDEVDWGYFARYECCANPNPCSSTTYQDVVNQDL